MLRQPIYRSLIRQAAPARNCVGGSDCSQYNRNRSKCQHTDGCSYIFESVRQQFRELYEKELNENRKNALIIALQAKFTQNKKICFVLDTSMNKNIVPFVRNSDLLVCESSFSSDLEERAKEYNHMTSKQAGEVAKKARVKKLILTHISQRYEKKTQEILNEAKKIFKNSVLAKDLGVFEI